VDLINGNDGPTCIKKFYCKGCKWVTNNTMIPNGCVYPDIDWMDVPFGNILPKSLEAPTWCPYLLKTLRKEKLSELDERTDKENKENNILVQGML